MSFSDSFAQRMSPLPTPGALIADAGEVAEFLEQAHQAWENACGVKILIYSCRAIPGAS